MMKVIPTPRGIIPHKQYTIPEVVSLTGISRSQLYNLMDSGKVAFTKPALHRIISGRNVMKIINKAV